MRFVLTEERSTIYSVLIEAESEEEVRRQWRGPGRSCPGLLTILEDDGEVEIMVEPERKIK